MTERPKSRAVLTNTGLVLSFVPCWSDGSQENRPQRPPAGASRRDRRHRGRGPAPAGRGRRRCTVPPGRGPRAGHGLLGHVPLLHVPRRAADRSDRRGATTPWATSPRRRLSPARRVSVRWRAVCRAIRAWALEHPHEYALIYGSPVPGYLAPEVTLAPASRVDLGLGAAFWPTPRSPGNSTLPTSPRSPAPLGPRSVRSRRLPCRGFRSRRPLRAFWRGPSSSGRSTSNSSDASTVCWRNPKCSSSTP